MLPPSLSLSPFPMPTVATEQARSLDPALPDAYFCPNDSDVVACPLGYYCPAGSNSPTPCPIGMYSVTEKAADTDACLACPRAGYYCEGEANADPTGMCPTGKYCEEETAVPQPCPVGTYCPEGLSAPVTCPEASYAPEYTYRLYDRYTGCDSHRHLERDRDVHSCTCDVSTPTLSIYKSESLQERYPTDEELDSGKPCPAGHYCPTGSYEPIPCPAGTYNPYERQDSLASCLYCSGSSHSTSPGSVTCAFCGGSSVADAAGTSCRCEGRNRFYQESIHACICSRGSGSFENGVDLSLQDGSTDCVERVYSSCGGSTVRDFEGACIDPTELCAQQCASGTGTYHAELNSCICTDLKTADEVCDISCRRRMQTMKLTKTDLVFLDSESAPLASIPLSKLSGRSLIMAGEPACNETAGCPVIVFNCTEAGLKGLFGTPTDLQTNIEGRLTTNTTPGTFFTASGLGRRATNGEIPENNHENDFARDSPVERDDLLNPGILNPVRCIQQGTSVAFLVHPGNAQSKPLYPVYLQQSFFNTESDFDFGHLT
ncbi:unnamed protein product, partial [Rangifer tarandus platyrhynchus]